MLRARQHYFCFYCNIQIIFRLPEPQIKRAVIVSECMPTGLGHPYVSGPATGPFSLLRGTRQQRVI